MARLSPHEVPNFSVPFDFEATRHADEQMSKLRPSRSSPHHSPYGDKVLRARTAALSRGATPHREGRGPPVAPATAGAAGRGRGVWKQQRQRRSSGGSTDDIRRSPAGAFPVVSAGGRAPPGLSPLQPRGAALRPENRPPEPSLSSHLTAALTPEQRSHVAAAQQQTRAVTPGKVDAYLLGFHEGTKNAAAMIEIQQRLGSQFSEEHQLRSQSWADSDATSKTHGFPRCVRIHQPTSKESSSLTLGMLGMFACQLLPRAHGTDLVPGLGACPARLQPQHQPLRQHGLP